MGLKKWSEATVAEIKRIVGDNKAYLIFDIGCLDPAYAPGTGTPVIGGLTSYLALEIIRGLTSEDNLGSISLLKKLGMDFDKKVKMSDDDPGTVLYS